MPWLTKIRCSPHSLCLGRELGSKQLCMHPSIGVPLCCEPANEMSHRKDRALSSTTSPIALHDPPPGYPPALALGPTRTGSHCSQWRRAVLFDCPLSAPCVEGKAIDVPGPKQKFMLASCLNGAVRTPPWRQGSVFWGKVRFSPSLTQAKIRD